MSQWITTSDLGNYTQGKEVSIQLRATPTYGGRIVYELQQGSYLPSGLTLNRSSGVISGTAPFTNENLGYQFSISATEIVGTVSYPLFQIFTMTITNLVWDTPAGDIGVFPENVPISSNENPNGYQFKTTPSQPGHSVSIRLLNGELPKTSTGQLNISETGLLTGIPSEVVELTTSFFTLRALEYDNLGQLLTFKDRTFSISISGITEPSFVIPSGTTILSIEDCTWCEYQVPFSNNDNLSFTISVVTGSLPPGLEMNSSGLIRGYADPPVSSTGQAIVKTYTFELEISSKSGLNVASYSITVTNQQVDTNFKGRKPTILNTRPLNFVISNNDVYKPYYLTSSSIGTYSQNDNFLFKIIGHDFEGATLTYEVSGLSSVGVTNDQVTGWQAGVLIDVDNGIQTYNVTARVYKIVDNERIYSDTIILNITIAGNVNTQISWISDTDLGVIYNGEISSKSVSAVSDQGLKLLYRMVGNELDSDLRTIISTPYDFKSFGTRNQYVAGTQDARNWSEQITFSQIPSIFDFTDSLYESSSQRTLITAYDENDYPFVILLNDDGTWRLANINFQGPNRLYSLMKSGIEYVFVGENGMIFVTEDPSNLQYAPALISEVSLYSVASNDSNTVWVTVGDNGSIFYTNNTTNNLGYQWIPVTNSGVTENLKSVTWANGKFVVVGDLGVIGTSTDGISWSWLPSVGTTLNKVFYNATKNITLAVGFAGTIIRIDNNLTSWTYVINQVTIDDLYGICFDVFSGNKFVIVGENGTILIYDLNSSLPENQRVSSPTITKLPPDLVLLPSGEISGRLAFESTDQIVPVNTNRTYTFSVQAFSGDFPEIRSTKKFTLTTNQRFNFPYDNIYIRSMLGNQDKSKLISLLNNQNLIPAQAIYRPDDPYFGKAKTIVYQHMFGVPTIPDNEFYSRYLPAVELNHYWRNITLGEIKTAQAKDENNNVIYEVVYSQIVDDLINSDGISISKQIVWPRTISLGLNRFYTSLIDVFTSDTYYDLPPVVGRLSDTVTNSVRIPIYNVSSIKPFMNVTGPGIVNKPDGTPPLVVTVEESPTGGGIVILDYAQPSLPWNSQIFFRQPAVTSGEPGAVRTLYPNSLPNMREQIYEAIGRVNDATILPLWMTSQQADGNSLGYTPAWVICYTKPGFSKIVKENIETKWEYKLNQINFQLDRFEVDRSKTYNYLGTTQGTLTPTPVWATLPSAQPNIIGDVLDKYVYFPRKTILPDSTEE